MNLYYEPELRKMPLWAVRSVVNKIIESIATDATAMLLTAEAAVANPESEELWRKLDAKASAMGGRMIDGFMPLSVVDCLKRTAKILHQKELDALWLLRATRPLEESKP